MFKKVMTAVAVVLASSTMVNAAEAAKSNDVAMPLYAQSDATVKQCVAAAKGIDARRMCYSKASDMLYNKAEEDFKAAMSACKATDSAEDCTAAVQKAHDTYISYYDQMMVVLTSLNAQANKDSMANTEQLMLNITANHALLLEQALKTAKAK